MRPSSTCGATAHTRAAKRAKTTSSPDASRIPSRASIAAIRDARFVYAVAPSPVKRRAGGFAALVTKPSLARYEPL